MSLPPSDITDFRQWTSPISFAFGRQNRDPGWGQINCTLKRSEAHIQKGNYTAFIGRPDCRKKKNRTMLIGKKLISQGCYACVGCTVIISCISAFAIFSLINSGQPVCLPGVSIRCHENDCGRLFQRCGSNKLLEIPADKVCYEGALVSARRTDLHSCPSTTIAGNSSRSQDQSSDQLGCCHCNSCNYPSSCDCLCQYGGCAGNLDLPSKSWGVRQVKCKLPVIRTYPNARVASCCHSGLYSTQNCTPVPLWEVALQSLQQQFTNLFTGQWFLQDVVDSFTFKTPLKDSCCNVSGSCGSVCG